MREDTRTPESVTVKVIKGVRYTVKVFDERAYHATIARYYPENESAAPVSTIPSRARGAFPYARRKAASRYNWTGNYKSLLDQNAPARPALLPAS